MQQKNELAIIGHSLFQVETSPWRYRMVTWVMFFLLPGGSAATFCYCGSTAALWICAVGMFYAATLCVMMFCFGMIY